MKFVNHSRLNNQQNWGGGGWLLWLPGISIRFEAPIFVAGEHTSLSTFVDQPKFSSQIRVVIHSEKEKVTI